MSIGSTVSINLHRTAVNNDFAETLLEDEKCKHCGRELVTQYSLKTQCCGACSRRGLNGRPIMNKSTERKKARAEKHGWDYAFNAGYGKQFFHAFDKAFDLQPIIVEVNCDTTNKNSSTEYNMNAARSRNTTIFGLGKSGGSLTNSLFQPHSVARSITSDLESEDESSTPSGAIPARLFLSVNPITLQDIGGHDSSIPTTYYPVLAEQKHAGRFLRYVTNFQSKGFPPACPPFQEPASDFALVQPSFFPTVNYLSN